MGIGNAIIGALRVQLGLDSAAFTTGLKLAQGDVDRFGRLSKISLLGVASAAAGLAIGFGLATKSAINHADALSKSAQKAGVTTEAFTRLAYAASYSDVSTEDLTSSLGKLSKTMAEATQNGTSTAASAFKALGVTVTDSSGNLRDASKVMTDIADRFSHIEDGATKTAISMALFGKSGAQLIPFLNGGADDIKRLEAQADQLGITLSTKTGKAAEKFNDTLGILGWVVNGVFNKVAEKALPALQDLVQTLASPKFAEAAGTLSTGVVTAITAITQAVTGATRALSDLWKAFTNRAGAGAAGASIEDIKKQIEDWQHFATLAPQNVERSKNQIAALQAELAARANGGTTFGGSAFDGGWGSGAFAPKDTGGGGGGGGGGGDTNLSLFTDGLKKAQQAIDPFAARVDEMSSVLTATVDPFSQMKMDLTDLQTMFDHGRISAGQFGDAIFKTTAGGVGALADLASGATAALSSMFKDNKAIAVANAVVNGIGSVAKTFETYGATPWGFAAAGIAAATAAANVASILSTNENSSSVPSAGGTAGPAAAAAAPQQGVTFNIHGSGVVGVDDIVNQIVQQAKDGGYSDLVQVMRVG